MDPTTTQKKKEKSQKTQTQTEKKYHRKTKDQLKEHKSYQCGFEECQKNFHDYSSLYTHINKEHNGQIHPDTVYKPPKKAELLEYYLKEKGNIIKDPQFSIEIDEIITYFFDKVGLLQTYLIFQALLPQDLKFSQYFHAENEAYFDIIELKTLSDFDSLFEKEHFKEIIIMQEYLKPFEHSTAIELARILHLIIKNQQNSRETILLKIQNELTQNSKMYKNLNQINLEMYFEGLIEDFIPAFQEFPDEYLYTLYNDPYYSHLLENTSVSEQRVYSHTINDSKSQTHQSEIEILSHEYNYPNQIQRQNSSTLQNQAQINNKKQEKQYHKQQNQKIQQQKYTYDDYQINQNNENNDNFANVNINVNAYQVNNYPPQKQDQEQQQLIPDYLYNQYYPQNNNQK